MLNQDYKEMLSLLIENKVEFLLIGAYALAAHGFPRATADMDIFVKPDPENASALMDVLKKFGAPLNNISSTDFSKPGIIFQIGVAPCRIDIITKIDGLTFDEAAQKKETVAIDQLQVPVISKQNLIKNKRASGRDKDLLDAKNLESS